MIQKWADLLYKHSEKSVDMTDEEREIHCYGLECLLATIMQNLVLLCLAVMLNLLPETIAFTITFGTHKK